ncbi:MAG: DUF1559 domain-containing protein [Lentisphaeraceae bacterium]|nr:DUF1559 domain-containing protein [Lentisphaeraceae bacterium]
MKRFTLIELLVVVAIIGILVSILLPAIGKARAATKAAVCTSNQKQIGIAIMSYSSSNNGIFPYGLSIPAGQMENENNKHGGLVPTMQSLWSDIGESVDVFTCPLDPTPENYNFWTPEEKRPNFQDENEKASYMFNEYGLWWAAKFWQTPVYLSAIEVESSEWVMAGDGRTLPSAGTTWKRANPLNTGQWSLIDCYHPNTKVNFLFGDGHVSPINAFISDTFRTNPRL